MGEIIIRQMYGKLQECELLSVMELYDTECEIARYLYKGKDWVYFAFEHKYPHKPLLISLDSSSIYSTLDFQMRNRPKKQKAKFNFLKLKLIKAV